jgi:plastocyanin
MAQAAAPEEPSLRPSPAAVRVLIPLGVGLLVALAIYIVATAITPDARSSLFGTSGTGTFPLKSALASGVLAFAAFQLYTSLWLYGKINRKRALPRRLGIVHRVSGYSAILLSLPIAYNCLLAYGFEDFDRRVLVHALAGCFFYGAFAAKIVIVRSKRLPGWTLPMAGGTLITIIVLLWYSAALWYYNDFDSPGLSPSVPAASKSAGATGYGPAPGGGTAAKGGPVAPVSGGFVQVAYKGIAIAPDPIAVHVGQKIKWTNFDSTRHNVISQPNSSEKFTSPDFVKGGTFVYSPKKVGVIHYMCTFHPASMIGTVTVVK